MPRPGRTATPPRWLKPMNRAFLLIRKFGGMRELTVLTVPGRRSGKPRSTPLTVITLDGDRYLLEGFPGADWARNIRAAGGFAEFATGRTVERVHLAELEPEAAIPVLRAWPELAGTDGPRLMRDAGVVEAVTPDAFATLAGRCAVFRIDPA
ncbi:nitroreductase/quinone reductase family protein [Nocardia sp. NPDC003345]